MNAIERLKNLVNLAEQFRKTEIVTLTTNDDDYPAYRDRFDFAVALAKRWLADPRRTIVCLCGSSRFKDAFVEANKRLTLEGKIVLSIGMFGHHEGLDMNGPIKAELDRLHFDKIDLADEILVLNVGGYIGESTSREIHFAEQCGKVINYLEPMSK